MREISFLPGPVAIYPECRKAFVKPPLSHRSGRFDRLIRDTENMLVRLTGARHCTFMMGSATLANEAVAAQLSLLGGSGLILSNGEFGERLAEQASRQKLDFQHLCFGWGLPLDCGKVALHLKNRRWLWFVYCETSTGTLNDLSHLAELCRKHNVLLCVDAVSAIGCVPVDLSGVYLASGTSGKGLGAYPGISFVLSNHCPVVSAKIPKYLDIGYYRQKNLVPFTFSSNLLGALRAGAAKALRGGHHNRVQAISDALEKFARDCGIAYANEPAVKAAFMHTLALSSASSSERLGRYLADRGILIHYRNAYLLERNWVQIALMGNVKLTQVKKLLAAMKVYFKAEASACAQPAAAVSSTKN